MPCVKNSIKEAGLFNTAGFFCFLYHHEFHIGNVHGSIAFYVIDKHFIQDVNYVLVRRFLVRFDNHHKVTGIGALFLGKNHIPDVFEPGRV
jgi:hypothetical protein